MDGSAIRMGGDGSNWSPIGNGCSDPNNQACHQPNNNNNDEDCLYLDVNEGNFRDAWCGGSFAFVCEMQATLDNIPALFHSCPVDWTLHEKTCYRPYDKSSDSPATWTDSHKACLNLGAGLAIVRDADTVAAFLDLKILTPEGSWLGGEQPTDSVDRPEGGWEEPSGGWQWLDGTPVTASNWAPGEPANSPQNEDCLWMSHEGGNFRDAPCTENYAFTCEKPATIPAHKDCPAGWFMFKSTCYGTGSLNRADWTKARAACEAEKAELATLDREAALALRSAYTADTGNPWTAGKVWLGGSQADGRLDHTLGNQENWHWTDGSRISLQVQTAAWQDGEPNDKTGGDNRGPADCLYLTEQLEWADDRCDFELAYMCQKPVPEIPIAINSVMDEVTCFKQPEDQNKIDATDKKLPFLDIFLNPYRKLEKENIIENQRNLSGEYFSHISHVYPELFRLLWHSSLPCSPQPDVSNDSLVKSCQVAGESVDCSALFTKVPTDLGLCCSLNSVQHVLKHSEYGQLVEEQQSRANWTGVLAGAGMRKGIKLVLDLHSDQQSFGSVFGEASGFKVFIGQKSEFPVLQQRSLPIQPGAEHRLDLSATKLTTKGIRGIKPEDRRCYFEDEGNLDFYEDYSYISCMFECKLL